MSVIAESKNRVKLEYLENLWDESAAAGMDEPELLRYRSNLLGSDLGSIRRSGFATLYLDKLLVLEKLYRGVDREDEMVAYYPLCTFGLNPVAASIDTPLHGFLPFRHVDHLHPDCAIAVAAAANGLEK